MKINPIKTTRLKKGIIPVILLITTSLHDMHGQEQFNIPDYIRERFNRYCQAVPREEIFVQTDRVEYISGEDLWFNLYLVDWQTLKPSFSKIAYFEFLSPDNKPVIRKRILLEDGCGQGQVALPDTLRSGIYTVRAYTSWMKNFLPVNCFLKEIRVYNPLRTSSFAGTGKSSELPVLPKADGTGLDLKINDNRQDSLEIFLITNQKFRSENSNTAFLFIRTRGNIDHLSTCSIVDQTTRITIARTVLTPGINQISVLDTKGPVIDRFIYTPFVEERLLTLISPDSCAKRSKIVVEIMPSNGAVAGNLTNLCISAAIKTDDRGITHPDDYLIPGTEFGPPLNLLKGKRLRELEKEVRDSLLLTFKSNWIIWEDIFLNEPQLLKYPAENEDHLIYGRLLSGDFRPAKADETLLMSVPGKEASFQYTKTDKNGNFNFRTPIDNKLKDMIFQPDLAIKNQKIYIEPSFSEECLPLQQVADSSFTLPKSALRQSINYQVSEIYGSTTVVEGEDPVIPLAAPGRFYGKPDFEVILKDYIQLDSMPEVFFELVPHVAMKRVDSNYEISILDLSNRKLEGIPCVMLDGVIIRDLRVIADLDPGLVDKIDIVCEKYRRGGYIFNGIVNVITKDGDFSHGTLPSDAVRLRYRISEPAAEFRFPDYTSDAKRENREPDYRNTLYWNPSVKTDNDGKAKIEFWTGDVKADYLITLTGITPEGKTVCISKVLKVR